MVVAPMGARVNPPDPGGGAADTNQQSNASMRYGGFSMITTWSWLSPKLALMLCLAGELVLAGPARAGAAEGAKVFEDNKCIACHSVNGRAGKLAKKGGPLDGVGAKRDAAWLKKYLQAPTSMIPDAQMEKCDVTGADLDALVAYLGSLK